jgi:hypothetical protein
VCQTRTADVVDVAYVNNVTLSTGCVRVGEAAKGGQFLTNQGQSGWVFAPRARKLVLQVSKKAGNRNEGWQVKKELAMRSKGLG